MADGGLCSEVEEGYGRSRYLKWEDFLLEEKSGNVTEIDVGCIAKPSFSRWDLLRGERFFNKTVSVEMVEELTKSWNILGKPLLPIIHFLNCLLVVMNSILDLIRNWETSNTHSLKISNI
jgi:hypothetical protein